jgi:CcmD family protein
VTQGQYVAAAYGAVFVFVLVYVAIIAAKLARLQRETAELLELARARERIGRPPDYAAPVRGTSEGAMETQ